MGGITGENLLKLLECRLEDVYKRQTKNNARTRKGRKKTVANKKKATK